MSNSSDRPVLTSDAYLKDRVKFKIDAYTKKGDWYRWGYIAMACTATVSAATVPVLINLKTVPSIYPTLLSLLVTVVVSLEGLLHFREHWRNYDLMKSYLRQEMIHFQTGAGIYRTQPDSWTAYTLFVERVEAEIARERSDTIEMRTAREVRTESQSQARPLHEREVAPMASTAPGGPSSSTQLSDSSVPAPIPPKP